MFRHAKRDVHIFSEIRQPRPVQRGSMATPVRRVARAYHHTRPEVRNTALAHPENNCEYDIEAPSQASGYPENHSGSPTVLSESSGTKSDGPRKRSPMRLPGSPRPEEADIGNRLPLNPVDAKHNTTPFLDDLSVYDQYLRQRLRNSSEEFEEFKEHILHINASVFNWSVTSYQFFWSVSWYIIVYLCSPGFHCQCCGSMVSPSRDNGVSIQARRCSMDSLDLGYNLTYCARTHLSLR